MIAMYANYSIKWKSLIISLLIPLGVGALSGFLTKNNTEIYKMLIQPPLSPPSIVFPIVWTLLFLLMGISSYLIYNSKTSNSTDKKSALIVYGIQLIVNFVWSLLFFNMQAYLFAFIWLVLLWLLIILMIIKFSKINKPAALLQLPYLLWVTFAGYLNLGIWLLNR